MITPPAYKKDAVPTPQGWRDPRTNELLVARKISQDDIDLYNGIEVQVEDDIVIEQLNEAPPNNKSLSDMSKFELQELAAMYDIDFKPSASKSKLISLIEEAQSS